MNWNWVRLRKHLTIALLLVFCSLGHQVQASVSAKSGITNVSVELVPTVFFEPVQADASAFRKLPFETVELMILNSEQAQALGFINISDVQMFFQTGTSPQQGKEYLVIVEAWQRFEVRRAKYMKAYVKAVEVEAVKLGKSVDLSAMETYSDTDASKIDSTLVKYGVSFRTVFVVEVEREEGKPVSLIEYFNGSRRMLAKIEVAGSASPSLTKELPGVFKLLTGFEGISSFLRDVTSARQQIWDGFLSDTGVQPNLQVLGWAFKPSATAPPEPGR